MNQFGEFFSSFGNSMYYTTFQTDFGSFSRSEEIFTFSLAHSGMGEMD